ncbi:MAG TPA: MerR family transcriptional regulator, partial [Opitutaceae bacterium]|nr:MerR family transcriptional regulator [Opitutaceae bacterium]
MSEPMHTIQQAAERAGITAHVVRAWEKRYGAVQPARTGTQRRRYTEEDVERLTLLAALARAGHAIGG